MKNTFFLLVLSLLFMFGMSSCSQVNGHGPVIQETRKLKGFNTIISDLPTDVYISRADNFEVSLEGQENILDLTESNLENNRLTFKIKDGYSVSGGIHLVVRVKCPVINGLINAGSGHMEVLNHFQTKFLRIKLPGSGNIQLAGIWAEQLNVTLSGSGDINIKDGETKDFNCLLSGSGNINSSNMDEVNADLQISGLGNISIGKSDSLDAFISGNGVISYYGNPEVHQQISGTGSLKRL